ncbi:MAG: hypothetical protein ACR2GR_06180 [Rhodothermales bacterium]
MKPVRRAGYGGLLFAALLLLSLSHSVEAQTTADVRGTVQLRLSGGLRLTNTEYDPDLVTPRSENLLDRRSYGQGEVEVSLSSAISVSAVLAFLAARDRYEDRICPFAGPCFEMASHLALRFFMPEARVKYHRRLRRSDLYVGAGVGYGFGRLTEQVTTEASGVDGRSIDRGRQANASGLSFSFFTGFSYDLTRRFALFGEAGYRSLKADFSPEEDAFNPPPYRFTGPFALMGIGLTL